MILFKILVTLVALIAFLLIVALLVKKKYTITREVTITVLWEKHIITCAFIKTKSIITIGYCWIRMLKLKSKERKTGNRDWFCTSKARAKRQVWANGKI